ncbi:MAG: methionine aminopeptidase [Phycisphaeraceae bacterium]|nr:MAG: methionine aminopeptidase [Phycisphaeraceae bacterium]
MSRPPVRNQADADAATAAAEKVVEIHRRLSKHLAAGQTLGQIDAFVGKCLDDLGCKSCFFKYSPGRMPPFPSQACLSVNECVVHGTAGYRTEPLGEGDVLKIDIGVSYRGWIGDAAWTYVFGTPTDEVARLCKAGKQSLALGIEQIGPRTPYMEWAKAVQSCVEGDFGFHLVRGLGGHGYGRKLHAPPFVSNTVPNSPFEWPEARMTPEPGTLIALEPMLAVGTGQTRQEPRTWPIYSADGSMTVHYEHDVLVTEDGNRVLTAGLTEIEDVITR